METSSEYKESEIPVPWGVIAVKAWGNPSGQQVLVLHGIQDNCGSFDRLIPLLPKSFYYHCIDLPGHGKSTHFSPGKPLYFFDYVYCVKLVVEFLKWPRFIMMGHSLGAQISVYFSALYPEKVEKAVLIDGMIPAITNEKKVVAYLRNYFDSLQKAEEVLKLKKPPSYTEAEALRRLIDNRPAVIHEEPARNLLKRCLLPSGDGFRYSTDQRLKLRLRTLLTLEQTRDITANMTCPTLVIIAKDTYDLIDAAAEGNYHEVFQKLFVAKPNFNFVLVKGNHDVHMNYPERVAPYVQAFLLKPPKSNL